LPFDFLVLIYVGKSTENKSLKKEGNNFMKAVASSGIRVMELLNRLITAFEVDELD